MDWPNIRPKIWSLTLLSDKVFLLMLDNHAMDLHVF